MTKKEIKEQAFELIKYYMILGEANRRPTKDIYLNRCYAITSMLAGLQLLDPETTFAIDDEIRKGLRYE